MQEPMEWVSLRLPADLIEMAEAQVGIQGRNVSEVYRGALQRGLKEEISMQAVSPLLEAMNRGMPRYLGPLARAARADYFNSIINRELLKGLMEMVATLGFQLAGREFEDALKYAKEDVDKYEAKAVAKAKKLADRNKLVKYVEGGGLGNEESGATQMDP